MAPAGDVMVLAPAPSLTISFDLRGEEPEVHLHPGGQGFWIARLLASLDVPVTLCGCFGGEPGAMLVPLVEREGVRVRSTRTETPNEVVVDDHRSGERQRLLETPARPLARHELDELYGAALVEGLAATVCVLGGPPQPDALPADTYRRLASDLRGNGRAVVADLAGAPLTAAVAGGLDVLKVSAEELQQDGRARADDAETIVDAIASLRAAGAAAVIVSRASEPALAAWSTEVVEVAVPRVEPVDERGAGDAMTAGITAGLARDSSIAEAVRLGAAAGALNVARRGLATGHRPEIEEMVEHIQLRPHPGQPHPQTEPAEVATVDDLAHQARARGASP